MIPGVLSTSCGTVALNPAHRGTAWQGLTEGLEGIGVDQDEGQQGVCRQLCRVVAQVLQQQPPEQQLHKAGKEPVAWTCMRLSACHHQLHKSSRFTDFRAVPRQAQVKLHETQMQVTQRSIAEKEQVLLHSAMGITCGPVLLADSHTQMPSCNIVRQDYQWQAAPCGLVMPGWPLLVAT